MGIAFSRSIFYQTPNIHSLYLFTHSPIATPLRNVPAVKLELRISKLLRTVNNCFVNLISQVNPNTNTFGEYSSCGWLVRLVGLRQHHYSRATQGHLVFEDFEERNLDPGSEGEGRGSHHLISQLQNVPEQNELSEQQECW